MEWCQSRSCKAAGKRGSPYPSRTGKLPGLSSPHGFPSPYQVRGRLYGKCGPRRVGWRDWEAGDGFPSPYQVRGRLYGNDEWAGRNCSELMRHGQLAFRQRESPHLNLPPRGEEAKPPPLNSEQLRLANAVWTELPPRGEGMPIMIRGDYDTRVTEVQMWLS